MDDLDIHKALANRLTAISAPTGRAGGGIRAAYPVPPDTLGALPVAVVMPGPDSIEYGAASRRTVLTCTVTIYLSLQPDSERRYTDLLLWRTWLRNAYDGTVLLGGEAAQASVTSTSIGNATWGDQTYITIAADVDVVNLEGKSFA
jgi:hypothetical protein